MVLPENHPGDVDRLSPVHSDVSPASGMQKSLCSAGISLNALVTSPRDSSASLNLGKALEAVPHLFSDFNPQTLRSGMVIGKLCVASPRRLSSQASSFKWNICPKVCDSERRSFDMGETRGPKDGDECVVPQLEWGGGDGSAG